MESPIVLPLDAMSENQALAIAERLQGLVWGYKVNDLLVECGVDIITKLKKYGRVFADPKLHDIPNTIANGVKKLDEAGADLITVHASGGSKMIQEACRTARHAKILAVTVLTSLTDADAQQVYGNSAAETVRKFALLAKEAGAYGIVCSPEELAMLSEESTLKELKKVVPGIRPTWYEKADDQSRKATPRGARDLGADLLVIGRPIIKHEDPRKAAEMVLAELK